MFVKHQREGPSDILKHNYFYRHIVHYKNNFQILNLLKAFKVYLAYSIFYVIVILDGYHYFIQIKMQSSASFI